MRYVLLLAISLYCSVTICGQKPRQAYCEVIVWSHQIMFNAAVSFDFGMQSHTATVLYDTKNQPLKFITGMDAVNYLSKRGWKLVFTYYESNSKSESTHYIMEKTVTSEKQVKEGLIMQQIKLDDFIKKFQIPNSSPN